MIIQNFIEFICDIRHVILVIHNYQKCVISGDRTDYMIKHQAIDSFTCSSGASGQGFDNDEILSCGIGEGSLSEYLDKSLRNRAIVVIAGNVFVLDRKSVV